jgi:thiosulfate reductase cytochrome b subunit
MKFQIEKKHSLMVRWNHWVNFPALTIMVWSGFLIYWASPAYFIPGTWLDAIGWNYQLAKGMAWHFAFGILFVVNGLLYVGYLLYSGEWRFPHYHGLQRWAYWGVIGLALLAILSGFAIFKPIQLSGLAWMFGGYTPARLIHFLIAWGFISFFIVHVIQVARAGWNTFRAMITGWEKKDE